jgi:two-component system, cell cycle response regulator DivK
VRDRSALILLVDDVEDTRDIYSTYLTFHGYKIICAADGPEAIRVAEQLHPTLILMDLRLPGMTGTEALHKLRAKPQFADVPIVAFTAHALDDERTKALREGFDAFITKPCLPDDLLTAINGILAQWPDSSRT